MMKVLDKFEVKEDRYYSKEHEWIKVLDDGTVLLGITDFAQNELGDVAFADLPDDGEETKADQVLFQIESVKAVADIYCPVSGEIIEVNTNLEDTPEKINEDPFGEGWMVKIKPNNLETELKTMMNAQEYAEFIKSEKGE